MKDTRVTTPTKPVRVTNAGSLAGECVMLGMAAETAENDLAVRVHSEIRSYLVWLPDERWDFYVWGGSFEHKMSGAFSHAEVAIAIKGTL